MFDLNFVTIIASSSSEGEGLAFLIILPFVAATAVYTFIYKRYRNKDKRYMFEHVTDVHVENVDLHDEKVDHRTGLKSSHIRGDNSNNSLYRVRHVPVTPKNNLP